MANQMYTSAKDGLLGGLIDLDTAVIKVALLRSYTFSDSHVYVSNVTGAGGSIVGTPVALSSVSISSGVFDAADSVFTSVSAGAAIPALLVYQASAVTGGSDVASSSQRVILYIDSAGGSLPITPTGGNINVVWDNSLPGILAI